MGERSSFAKLLSIRGGLAATAARRVPLLLPINATGSNLLSNTHKQSIDSSKPELSNTSSEIYSDFSSCLLVREKSREEKMASNQNQASYAAGETKARTEEKTGQMMDKAGQATEATKQKAGEAKDKTAQTAQAAKDRAAESKDQTGSFLGEKTEAAKQKAAEATDAAKQKASETAQYAQERSSDAAQYTKESAVAGKDKTGSVLQQAGETVVSAVVGAKDAVANTLGMGGDNTNTAKDSTTEKITRDH